MSWISSHLITALLTCSLCVSQAGAAPGESPVAAKVSSWHGYQKHSFDLAGHPAFVVVPKVAAPGNPWIWRTSFPDFHSEVDQELAYNGYHIGFINVVAMLGSDASLDIMDQFYDHVRARWKLAEKPALEPCSRGGLHAYRYAARHPQRVSCIFGDVPVMDLKERNQTPTYQPTACFNRPSARNTPEIRTCGRKLST